MLKFQSNWLNYLLSKRSKWLKFSSHKSWQLIKKKDVQNFSELIILIKM